MDLYTFGYQGRTVGELVQAAVARDAMVFDIRLRPWSPRPQWCRGPMARALGERYVWAGGVLGNELYRAGGIRLVDEARGMAMVKGALSCHPVILVCACRDLSGCHREYIATRLSGEAVRSTELALQPGLV